MVWSLALHGGAGSPLPGTLSAPHERERVRVLQAALEAGERVLASGGAALDGVVAAVRVLEDEPIFNAGRGSVYASDRTQRMDASVMDGRSRRAGAVCDVRSIRHPVEAALAVARQSSHVLLAGDGAHELARRCGLQLVPAEHFADPHRLGQLEAAMAAGVVVLDHSAPLPGEAGGTVGAVARDQHGNLAAATSTGGMTGKSPGRVGDSAVIGAGTWAHNDTCAVSATGHGERFIELRVAGRIADLMELAGLSLQAACRRVVCMELVDFGGEGGVIAVDGAGRVSMPFNSAGMARAVRQTTGEVRIWGLGASDGPALVR